MYVDFVSDGSKRRGGFEAKLSVMVHKEKPKYNPFVVLAEVCATKHENGTTEVTRYEHTDVLEELYVAPKMIATPNHPSNYGKNTECVWAITVQKERLIKLKFLDDFVLQDSA